MLYLARRATMCISIHTHTYGSASDFCSLAVFQPELPLPLKLSDNIPPLDIIRSHRYVMYTVVLYTTYIHPAYTPIAFPSLCVSVRTVGTYTRVSCIQPFCSCVAIHGLTSRGSFTSRDWIFTLLFYIFYDFGYYHDIYANHWWPKLIKGARIGKCVGLRTKSIESFKESFEKKHVHTCM